MVEMATTKMMIKGNDKLKDDDPDANNGNGNDKDDDKKVMTN